MSKNKYGQNYGTDTDQHEVKLENDALALSVVQDGNKWKLIEFPYNLATLTVGTPKVLAIDDSMLEIEYQFKIAAAERMFK